MATSLHERIRKARQDYGMSQAELARRVNLSANAMNKIESGKTPYPGILQVLAIAEHLKVSLDYLTGRKDDPSIKQRTVAVAQP